MTLADDYFMLPLDKQMLAGRSKLSDVDDSTAALMIGPANLVQDIRSQRPDFAENDVICVYAYHPPVYAVYRTSTRVMVHFADDPPTALAQRARLACLTPLRGQINSLIDGWHTPPHRWFSGKKSPPHPLQKRALRYDRRVADALVVALEGDAALGMALLAEVKNDIINERIAMARADYLVVALVLVIALTLLTGLVASPMVSNAIQFPDAIDAVWTAVGGGTLGAFFSIAIGLKGRTVLIDLQNRQNVADVCLRMLIGAIAGGMLLCLLVSGLISNVLDYEQLTPGNEKYRVLLVFVIGFLAGFFERLVPDLLSQTNLGTREESSGTVAGPSARNSPPGPPTPPEGGAGAEGSASPARPG